MHRTQISLEDAQYQALVRESRRRGMSISALIRDLVDARLPAQATRASALDQITGIAAGTGEPVGQEHNRYLYGKQVS